MTLSGINETTYQLEPSSLGSGGNGDVYGVFGKNCAAKIYRPRVLTRELEQKLKIMIERSPNISVLTQASLPLY